MESTHALRANDRVSGMWGYISDLSDNGIAHLPNHNSMPLLQGGLCESCAFPKSLASQSASSPDPLKSDRVD
jgi:hypothetical protein